MDNSVKTLKWYYSNANSGMFSTVTVIIEVNRAIIPFLSFQFK